MQILQEIQLI